MNFSTLEQIAQGIFPQFIFNPFLCPGCKEHETRGVCSTCLRSLRRNHQLLLTQENGIRGIYPIFISLSNTHSLLTHWKDYGGSQLRRLLFSMSDSLKAELLEQQFEAIIPIPQNLDRSLKRGHASAFEAARYFSKELKVPLFSQQLHLKNIPKTKQADLDEWDRRHSQNPFHYEPCYENMNSPQRILLVDDFITTGSTLEKAANAILEKDPNVKIFAGSLGWKPKKQKSLPSH